jgi:hypothetical protein
MSNKDVSVWDAGLFDASDVEWAVIETKRRNKVNIELTSSEGSMNVVKIYLALKMICEKIEGQLNIMDECDGEH